MSNITYPLIFVFISPPIHYKTLIRARAGKHVLECFVLCTHRGIAKKQEAWYWAAGCLGMMGVMLRVRISNISRSLIMAYMPREGRIRGASSKTIGASHFCLIRPESFKYEERGFFFSLLTCIRLPSYYVCRQVLFELRLQMNHRKLVRCNPRDPPIGDRAWPSNDAGNIT